MVGVARLTAVLLGLLASTSPGGWYEVAPLPYAPSGLAVHSGGCLCAVSISGRTFIYAAKGNSTTDFYRYNTEADTWQDVTAVPRGNERKTVDDGACMCFDGIRYVYFVKGNYSQGFYRYDILTDTWQQLADIPLGPSGYSVRGGADVVLVDGRVYLLKGYRCDFLRYDPERNSWTILADAPTGVSPRWSEGSWLVHYGGRIFAHKPFYHEFYYYDIDAAAWSGMMSGIPLVGRSGRVTRCDDGSSAAVWNGSIYALKGNGLNEFWRHEIASTAWTELDSVPAFGSSGLERLPNYGADIVPADSSLYALKGNTTCEFWRYTPATPAVKAYPPMVYAALRPVAQPLRGRAWVRCWVPGHAPVRYRLTDAAGRVVRLGEARLEYGAVLDLGPCDTGVYFLTVTRGTLELDTRLVVSR